MREKQKGQLVSPKVVDPLLSYMLTKRKNQKKKRRFITLTNATDLHASTSQGTESRLGTGAGGLGAVTTGGTELDVEGSDADLLALDGDVLGSQHGGVGGSLITIGLDLHASGNTGDGFTASQISDVNEGIVEGGEDVGNTEDLLVTADLGTEGDVLLNLRGGLDLLGL